MGKESIIRLETLSLLAKIGSSISTLETKMLFNKFDIQYRCHKIKALLTFHFMPEIKSV